MDDGLTDAEARMIVERFLDTEPWISAIFALVAAKNTARFLRDALSGAVIERDGWSARASSSGIMVAHTPRGQLEQPAVIGWPEVAIHLRRSLATTQRGDTSPGPA